MKKRLAYWQKVMRLQDWNIGLEVVPLTGLSSPDRRAEISVDVNHKEAFIRVLRPEDYQPGPGENGLDMEMCLVHELVHIHLAPFDGVTEVIQEQVVDAFTKALVGLERRN